MLIKLSDGEEDSWWDPSKVLMVSKTGESSTIFFNEGSTIEVSVTVEEVAKMINDQDPAGYRFTELIKRLDRIGGVLERIDQKYRPRV